MFRIEQARRGGPDHLIPSSPVAQAGNTNSPDLLLRLLRLHDYFRRPDPVCRVPQNAQFQKYQLHPYVPSRSLCVSTDKNSLFSMTSAFFYPVRGGKTSQKRSGGNTALAFASVEIFQSPDSSIKFPVSNRSVRWTRDLCSMRHTEKGR